MVFVGPHMVAPLLSLPRIRTLQMWPGTGPQPTEHLQSLGQRLRRRLVALRVRRVR